MHVKLKFYIQGLFGLLKALRTLKCVLNAPIFLQELYMISLISFSDRTRKNVILFDINCHSL